MPYWVTRSNLAAAQFPFFSRWMGRSVIVPTFDQNPDSSISLEDKYKDKGQPQVFYMHNVVPTSQGFQSVGYMQKVVAAAYANPVFDSAFILRNTVEDRFLYSPGAQSGTNVDHNVFDPYIGAWRKYPASSAGIVRPLITTAYINNQTYIYIQGTGCFRYNKATPAIDAVAFTSLTAADIIGITAANGYMIAWSKTRVFWSSVTDPTDFVPSLQTGAGFGDVNDIKGPISFCLQISGGFVVYTERNAVGASYTGNIRYPFVFKEVVNSGGLQIIEDVITDTSNAEHYALTTSGLQRLDRQVATGVFPELTDFLTSNTFEDFDEAALVLTEEYLATPVIHKLSLCANRYLVCSYGKIQLTHALVYDLVMKRWCKLKLTHIDCFDYFSPEQVATPVPDQIKGSVGFLLVDGSVKTVDFSSNSAASSGVFILGKFQFSRNSMTQLSRFNWESANPAGQVFTSFVLPSLDGTSFDARVLPYLSRDTGGLKEYLCTVNATNVSVGAIGNFNLVSSEVELMKVGSR